MACRVAVVVSRDAVPADLARIEALAQAGRLELVVVKLRNLRQSIARKAPPPSPNQKNLLEWKPPVEGETIARPGDPRCGLVACVPFGGTILLKQCALQQLLRSGSHTVKGATTAGRRRDRSGKLHGVKANAFPQCRNCEQGRANLRRLPTDWKPPKYHRLRSDYRQQLQARAKWMREHIDVRTIDDE